MNDTATAEDTGTEVITIPHKTDVPALFSKEGGIEGLVAKIEEQARSVVTDISTAKGRKEVKALASKVSRSKTLIDEVGKEENDKRNRLNKEVNAQRNLAKERLDALRDEIKAPVLEWENAEAERQRQHMIKMDTFDLEQATGHDDTATIKGIIATIEGCEIDATWEEFEADAKAAKAAALVKYQADLGIAQAREAQEAELAQLRAEAAARAEEDAKRAEAQRLEAEAEAQRQAEEELARRAKQEAEEAAAKAAEQAKLDAAAAEARHAQELAEAEAKAERAAQAERDRIAADKAAEEELRAARAANKKHRQKIRSEVVKAIAALKPANVEEIVDAMMAGEIAHVEVKL